MAGWFRIANSRYIRFLGFQHVLMMLIVVSTILLSILAGGCTSEGLASVYLVSFSYSNPLSPVSVDPSQANTNVSGIFADVVGNASLEVRVGYLGICILGNVGGWICSKSASDLASIVLQEAGQAESASTQTGDPLNLLYVAQTVKDEIMFSGLIFISMGLAFIALLGLSTFPGWHDEVNSTGSEQEVKPFPSRPVSLGVLALLFASSIIGLIAALWQHLGSAAVLKMGQALSYGAVTGHVGAVAMVFGWLGFTLHSFACIGILVVILSIRILSQILA